ncbi:hypothetical protein C8R43DRAFT_940595 [Mycena crocata]|nr:hypothetical protein C8R43DRAFT_940595 [Mycena crocata]
MGKRRGRHKKPETEEAWLKRVDKAAKRKAASAKYYAEHPNLRDQKRVYMANKRWSFSAPHVFRRARLIHGLRAESKLKKRQWDPKKRLDRLDPRHAPQECAVETTTPHRRSPSPVLSLNKPDTSAAAIGSVSAGRASLTSPQSQTLAERTAMLVLAEMAQARTSGAPRGDKDDDSDDSSGDGRILALAAQLSSISMSVVGPLDRPPWAREMPHRDDALDNALEPDDSRSTGDPRPLTWAQTLQHMVAELNSVPLLGPTPAEANRWADLNNRDIPPELKTMGFKRWLEIWKWEDRTRDNSWDFAAQKEFAEAEASIRLHRIRDKRGLPVRAFFDRLGKQLIEF